MQVNEQGGQIQSVQCGGAAWRFDSFRDGWLWSTVEAAGLGDALPEYLEFFNYTKSQTVTHSDTMTARLADDRDTNMPKPNYMTADQEIWIAALYPEVIALSDQTVEGSGGEDQPQAIAPIPSMDSLKWCEYATVIRLILGVETEKPYMEGMFGYFATACDAMYVGSGDSPGGPQIMVGSLTYAGGRSARTADRLMHIAAKDRIEGRWYFPKGPTALPEGDNSLAYTLPQDLRVRFYLKGPRVLPVQGGSAA